MNPFEEKEGPREARSRLFEVVQKFSETRATGQRTKAPEAAQERLKAANQAALKLLSKSDASVSELEASCNDLEEAHHWVLDPGTSKKQEAIEAIRQKLKRFKDLIRNDPSVEGLRKREKKAEGEQLRAELLGQLVAPQDTEHRTLAKEFKDLCDELDRGITAARTRRRSSLSSTEILEQSGRPSTFGWISELVSRHPSRKEAEQRQLQVDVNAPLQEWNVADSFQVKPVPPVPRMEGAALNRLANDARMLSTASQHVASMVEQQDENMDAVEGDMHQTVQETGEVVGTLADVAVGKSKSRVLKATLGVGASGALIGVACTTLPLWGSLALGTGAATVTAIAGRAIHSRFTRNVRMVANQRR